MYQNILLTFDHIDGYYTYAWFETEDAAREFASNSTQIKCINECYDCYDEYLRTLSKEDWYKFFGINIGNSN